MKRTLTLIIILLTLTACTQTEAAPTAPTSTNTPVPPTATNTPVPPTATNTSEPTLTPTPMPYYLEDGSLYNLDESTGEYVLVGEGLAAITITAEGIVAVDGDGVAMYRYENGVWMEMEKVYRSGVEAIADVEARAEEEMGMSLHEMYVYAEENYYWPGGMGMGGGENSMSHISLGTEVISMEGRPGFSSSDRMIVLYGYNENDVGETYTVPVPVFVEKNGVLERLVRIEASDGGSGFYGGIEGGVVNFNQALDLMNQIGLGETVYLGLQLNWDADNPDIQANINRVSFYRDNIWSIMTDDFETRMSGQEFIWYAIDLLTYDDFGIFANLIRFYTYEE